MIQRWEPTRLFTLGLSEHVPLRLAMGATLPSPSRSGHRGPTRSGGAAGAGRCRRWSIPAGGPRPPSWSGSRCRSCGRSRRWRRGGDEIGHLLDAGDDRVPAGPGGDVVALGPVGHSGGSRTPRRWRCPPGPRDGARTAPEGAARSGRAVPGRRAGWRTGRSCRRRRPGAELAAVGELVPDVVGRGGAGEHRPSDPATRLASDAVPSVPRKAASAKELRLSPR
jgi:hypothetical protein